MAQKAFFQGLIFDEYENLVATSYVGGEAFYVIDDSGFHRHVEADKIDRQVLSIFLENLEANRDLAVTQAMKMMGKDDLFTKIAIDAQLNKLDMDEIMAQGLPEQARNMMGMMGFRIVVDYRGEVVRLDQPAQPDGDWS